MLNNIVFTDSGLFGNMIISKIFKVSNVTARTTRNQACPSLKRKNKFSSKCSLQIECTVYLSSHFKTCISVMIILVQRINTYQRMQVVF